MNCSAPYRAPELYDTPSNCKIDLKPDIWSLGCILFCIAYGFNPFESPTEGVKILAIQNGSFSFPESETYSNTFKNLV